MDINNYTEYEIELTQLSCVCGAWIYLAIELLGLHISEKNDKSAFNCSQSAANLDEFMCSHNICMRSIARQQHYYYYSDYVRSTAANVSCMRVCVCWRTCRECRVLDNLLFVSSCAPSQWWLCIAVSHAPSPIAKARPSPLSTPATAATTTPQTTRRHCRRRRQCFNYTHACRRACERCLHTERTCLRVFVYALACIRVSVCKCSLGIRTRASALAYNCKYARVGRKWICCRQQQMAEQIIYIGIVDAQRATAYRATLSSN